MSRWRQQLNRRHRRARERDVSPWAKAIARWQASEPELPFGAWLARNTVIDWSKAVPL